ncbi:MAG: TlpA family protein disulfide reductase [Actinomycetota bacterium]|nr:TlpA family protein disulfide reductase [Actinomycetota bacterium]
MRRLAALLLVVAVACSHATYAGVVEVSGRMPTVAGELLGGGRLSPASYRGKIVILNFWNPFCGPCRKEAPELERDWQRLGGEGVLVLGLHYTGGDWPASVPAARTYLRQYGITYPVLEDPGSRLALAFGIQGIPSTVVADANATLRFRILGAVKPGQLEQLVGQLRAT